MERVIIEVEGGVASCVSAPEGVEVIIRDKDDIASGGVDPLADEVCEKCGNFFDDNDGKVCNTCEDPMLLKDFNT